MNPSTLRDVARRVGVSTATVSRALSAETSHLVRESTRVRIVEAAADLGFVPSSIPANMRSHRSKVFGIVVSDIENAFFTGLTRAAEAEAHAAGYRLILVNTDEDPEKERGALAALASERVAGVILASVGDTSTASLKPLRGLGIPVVVVDNELPDAELDTVVTDNREASAQITRVLLDAGHRRIAMISGPERASSIRARVEGFRDAVREFGDAGVDALVLPGDLREERAAELTAELLARPEPPTAIYCVNNLSTMGALRACRSLGVSVPDQLSVIGFDDIPLREVLTPRQTVMAQPLAAMGAAAARALLDRIENPDRPVHRQVLPSALALGESVATIPHPEGGAS